MPLPIQKILFLGVCFFAYLLFPVAAAFSQGIDQNVFYLKQEAVPLLDENDKLVMQNRVLQKECLELKQEIDKLTQKLSELKGAPQTYQKLFKDKSGYQKDLEEGIKMLQGDISVIERTYQKLQKNSEEAKEKINKLRQRQEELSLFVEEFTAKVQKEAGSKETKAAFLDEQIDELREEIERTLSKNQLLKNNIGGSQDLFEAIKGRVRESEKQKNEALAELVETSNVYKLYVQQADELKEEGLSIKNLIDQEKEEKLQKKYLIENQIQLLEADIEDKNRKKELLVKEAQDDIFEQMKPLRQENQEIVEEVQSTEEKISQIYNQILEMNSSLSKDKEFFEEKNHLLAQETQKLQESISELENQSNLLRQKDRSLVRTFEDSVLSYEEYNKQLEAAKTNLIVEKQLLLKENDILGKKSSQIEDLIFIKQKENVLTRQEIEKEIREIKEAIALVNQQREEVVASAECKSRKQLEDEQFQNLSLTHQVLAAHMDIDKIKKEKEFLESLMYHKAEADYSPKITTGTAFVASPDSSNASAPEQKFFKTPAILKND